MGDNLILQCKIGSQVKVRVGGDFLYDPKPTDEAHNLLLIAGGKNHIKRGLQVISAVFPKTCSKLQDIFIYFFQMIYYQKRLN